MGTLDDTKKFRIFIIWATGKPEVPDLIGSSILDGKGNYGQEPVRALFQIKKWYHGAPSGESEKWYILPRTMYIVPGTFLFLS